MVVGFQFHKYKGKFIHSRKELQIVHANIFFHCDVQYNLTKDVIYYALKKTFFFASWALHQSYGQENKYVLLETSFFGCDIETKQSLHILISIIYKHTNPLHEK